MKKTLTIATAALLMAGGVAYACSGCGCQDKKSEKSDCGSCKSEKKEASYEQARSGDMLACGGKKSADDKKEAS